MNVGYVVVITHRVRYKVANTHYVFIIRFNIIIGVCGDGFCNDQQGENCTTCILDCRDCSKHLIVIYIIYVY